MWSWFLLLIFFVLFGFNGLSPSVTTSPEYITVSTNGIQGYIVPEPAAEGIL